jgi:hypothetical protein
MDEILDHLRPGNKLRGAIVAARLTANEGGIEPHMGRWREVRVGPVSTALARLNREGHAVQAERERAHTEAAAR